MTRRAIGWWCVLVFLGVPGGALAAEAEEAAKKPFEPVIGQAGRDVVWVPTPEALVEKMLDMAQVTPRDFVMDLGSGDGRNVIAAAKRGARALGVEYNPNMVELSRRRAAEAGVSERAQFVEGDMYKADVSEASVLALFLLTENLDKLAPNFLAMRPGSRIVSNGFTISGWTIEKTDSAEGECGSWCTAYLYIVPARVGGVWRLPGGQLVLKQDVQKISGTLTVGRTTVDITDGRVTGEVVRFTAGDAHYTGRIRRDAMRGTVTGSLGGAWAARRQAAE